MLDDISREPTYTGLAPAVFWSLTPVASFGAVLKNSPHQVSAFSISIMCHSEAHSSNGYPKGVEVRVLADEDSL